MKDRLLVLETIYIDPETREADELLLLNKINLLLRKIKTQKERLCILVCDEERQMFHR